MNILIKKFSPIILTISSILLIITFYKSEIIYDGNNRNYYKIYYLISSILISISIITFFLNDKIKQYLIISGISLVISLYLFEGYLTFEDKFSKKYQLYENQTGNKWDRRNKFEIYNEFIKNDNNVVVTVTPSSYLNKDDYSIFPLSGISNSKTVHCNENGYYSIYQSDRYGFNNPDREWDKKKIEYLLVGDSYVHGACVNRPDDISSVLRNLSNKSVLNLGQAGSGPLIEYATLREYLNTNVKKVLWIYFEGNDFENLITEKSNNFYLNYLNNFNFTQNLKIKQNEIDDLAENFIKEKVKIKVIDKETKKNNFKTKLIQFFKIQNTRILYLTPPTLVSQPTPALLLEFKKILKLTKEFTSENNSKLYFVYLPQYRRYKINYDNTNYNLVKNIVNGLSIPFIDLHKEVFGKESNPLKLFPFEQFGHYNVEGYKKVAETIYKYTKD